MTTKEIQKQATIAALKAYPGRFAQPSQATALVTTIELLAAEAKLTLPRGFSQSVADAYGPYFNASAVLQGLKKLGLVADELSAAQKAEAASILAGLKG